jgi:pyruvate kinase
MIRARRSRIVATIGPASSSPEMIITLAKAGADVFRLNFSHGSHDNHAASYKAIRDAEAVVGGRWASWPTCRVPSCAWASSPTVR